MRILLTNDDGIHAPGLTVLESIARELSDDLVVVAPETDQSGVAHSLSLSDPLRLREISPRHYAVKGTPTDCVIMGGQEDHGRPAAGPRALGGQPRAERRGGRHLFRDDRRRDGGSDARHSRDRAVAGLWRRAGQGDDRVGRDGGARRAAHPQDPVRRHRAGRPGQRQLSRLRSPARSQASPSPARVSATPN